VQPILCHIYRDHVQISMGYGMTGNQNGINETSKSTTDGHFEKQIFDFFFHLVIFICTLVLITYSI
jgi:hypothetical protein